MIRPKRRITIVLATTALALGAAAAVQASIPDGRGVIHGCYSKTSLGQNPPGALRVIDSSRQACNSNEVPLNWSQKGPTGGRGPTGPTGPRGLSLFADVKSDGTLVHGTATGATRISAGNYYVTFGQGVDNCAAVANVGGFNGFDSSTTEVAETGFSTSNVVVVNLTKLDGTQVDSSFHLILDC